MILPYDTGTSMYVNATLMKVACITFYFSLFVMIHSLAALVWRGCGVACKQGSTEEEDNNTALLPVTKVRGEEGGGGSLAPRGERAWEMRLGRRRGRE